MSQQDTPLLRTAVVLDPHPLCHEGLKRVLRPVGVDVVAAAPTPTSALALLAEREPDLFVAEVDGTDGPADGIRCLRLARQHHPELAIVVVSTASDARVVEAAFAAGATAYLAKTACPDEIAAAVSRALSPAIYLVSAGGSDAGGASRLGKTGRTVLVPTPAGHVTRLTRRELEVLRLVEGRSNRDVAKLLWVTDETVKFHLANVYRKLGVSNRAEAVAWARANGLLDAVAEASPYGPMLPTPVPAGGHAS